MRLADERGVALLMVLIMMGVLSVLGASLIFVSQTETWASQNYRLMTEARYAAESGVHRAAHFILNSYAAPTATGADPLSNYAINCSPVQTPSGGACNPSPSSTQHVRLSSISGGSNYPVTSVTTAFVNAVHGTLTGGTDTVTYDAVATLVAMRQVTVYGTTTPATVQTWHIRGIGTLGGAKPARVDVEAVLERQVTPMFSYAAFAVADGCGALSWSGGGSTDSYDSTQVVGGVATFTNAGGNVGTNGNLDQNGGPTTIYGSLSTPRSGVGSCATGAVTALTLSGSSPPTEGLVELPQPINYPTPDPPNPMPTDTACALPPIVGGIRTMNPGVCGNISLGGGQILALNPGVYNINSIKLVGNSQLRINPGGPVILNVAGINEANPVDFTGGSISNTVPLLDPSLFQITYGGTGTIKMAGGSNTAALVYAPNATVQNNSAGAEWYGAVIARYVTDAGHAVIHYDRNLSNTFMMVGPWMMNSFSWRRF